MNGKVFFTKVINDVEVGDFVCSGTSVNSPGRSLVWTAGHCVHGGAFFGYHTNWVFIPAFQSGACNVAMIVLRVPCGVEPYGKWPARVKLTTSGWADANDLSYDVGGAIVSRKDGVRLTEKIGGQGILFNLSRNQFFTAFGYPAEFPFNGNDQYQCPGVLPFSDDPGQGPETMGIICNMTKGASGGGWLIDIGPKGYGYINSVNSYKYDASAIMYGPYHGSTAHFLYLVMAPMSS